MTDNVKSHNFARTSADARTHAPAFSNIERRNKKAFLVDATMIMKNAVNLLVLVLAALCVYHVSAEERRIVTQEELVT